MGDDTVRELNVCHFITYYLPVTQNWIYNQLIYNKDCQSTVLCQRLINQQQFPFDDVYPICGSSGIGSIPNRLAHKIFERYPQKPHASIIGKIKPDILHGHFLLESWRNYHLVKRLNIPLVTTCYGQDVTSLLRKPLWGARSKKVFEIGKAFIVEGEHMGDTVVARGCPREKISIIKLGIDVARIDTNMSKGDAYNNTSIMDVSNNDKLRILFTGLNREKKGAVYAAKAFAKALSLTDVNLELHLLGDGVCRRSVEKILIDAGVRQKAVFHGMKPVSQYLELLKNTDLVLAPSVQAADGDTEGGAPVVVIEALCAGIPVVGSRHCDIPNIVAHGLTGLLSEERDIDALAKDIRTLAENPQLRIEMGNRGAKYARAEHDIEKQVRKITDVYREVIRVRIKDEHYFSEFSQTTRRGM
jgi:colanic acid/amylovoran biosynthesis glycosyltransferase